MNTLIVYAHQETGSFNHALYEKTLSVLKKRGDVIKTSDLYGMDFKAVAGREDFTGTIPSGLINYMLEQQKAASENRFTEDIKIEQEKLQWAELVILHFPIWWFSVPAILKGWFDRIMAAGVTWDFGKIYGDGLLRGKKGMCVATTGGPEEMYSKNGAHGTTINEVLYSVNHGTMAFCGMEVLPPFVAFSVFQVGEEGRKKYLAEYEELLANIDKIEPIRF